MPDEGLDSLISVSTQEDLENMMEEYDKLTGPSPKLRVFLFLLSDPGSGAEAIDRTDSDFSLRYCLHLILGIFDNNILYNTYFWGVIRRF